MNKPYFLCLQMAKLLINPWIAKKKSSWNLKMMFVIKWKIFIIILIFFCYCNTKILIFLFSPFANLFLQSPSDEHQNSQYGLTQAGLEEYSRSYYEQNMMYNHQKQSSYAQSEGYHSYVSSSDSTSTPFLDR